MHLLGLSMKGYITVPVRTTQSRSCHALLDIHKETQTTSTMIILALSSSFESHRKDIEEVSQRNIGNFERNLGLDNETLSKEAIQRLLVLNHSWGIDAMLNWTLSFTKGLDSLHLKNSGTPCIQYTSQ